MSYMYHYCGFLVKEFYSNVFYILVEKSWQLHKGCTNFHFHQVCMRTFQDPGNTYFLVWLKLGGYC